MNTQEINIAIAESMGWKYIEDMLPIPHGLSPVNVEQGLPDNFDYKWPIPSYTTDLNAMHEAWATLSHDDKMTFAFNLCIVMHGSYDASNLDWCRASDLIGATAAQRAEAYLKTLNLWTNS
jgi:hypothetical protein